LIQEQDMNRRTLRASVLAAAMLATSAAFAGDIVKCVDQNGHITLTENQCSDGVQTVLVAGGSEMPALSTEDAASVPVAARVRRGIQRVAYTPEAVQHDSWAPSRVRGKLLSRDAETLKAARVSMQVLDAASSALRHARLAGVN
jgi:hypothetical protein